MSLAAFTPTVIRRPRPQGNRTYTYQEYNGRPIEQFTHQDAPDPIRQGDTPSRLARMPIVITSTDPKDWNSGFAEEFLPYAHILTRQNQPAGRQLNIRAQNSVGVRPNIDRGTVSAYGSMFSLTGSTYDESRY